MPPKIGPGTPYRYAYDEGQLEPWRGSVWWALHIAMGLLGCAALAAFSAVAYEAMR